MDTATVAIVPIPLDQLVVSAHNARKIDRAPLDSLAASILAEGLLQNLTVIEGANGTFEVIAGKRRLGALKLLRERGDLPDALSSPPCRVVDDERAISASLAENIEREAMHPADEFLAFRRLYDNGRSIEEIAQEFGVIPLVVERRLRLANVAPSLFTLFQRDEIKLDQMMALAITEDHAAQEAVWNGARSSWDRGASNLRIKLMGQEFNIARDKAARFVGVDALEAAGCIIKRDLFSDAGDGYTRDRQLVDELALAKLDAAAEQVREEGWSWVEARVDHNEYGNEFGRIHATRNPGGLMADDRARLEALQAEKAKLDEIEDGDEWTAETSERYDALEEQIDELEARAEQWMPQQLAAAGAIATISHDGTLCVHRGLVRSGDRKAAKAAGGEVSGGRESKNRSNPDELSAPMLARLGAHRTAMLRAAALRNRNVSLALLAHALLVGLFDLAGTWSAKPSRIAFPTLDPLEKSASELPMMRYHAGALESLDTIRRSLPAPTKLLGWLLEAPVDTVLSLLSAASACAIDASIAAHDKAHETSIGEIVAALGIDFAEHWEPTRETFLAHVPRPVIEQAVREARGDADVGKLEGLKKDQAIDAAEQLLAGRGWLPKPLRGPKIKAKSAPAAPQDKAQPKLKNPAAEKARDKSRKLLAERSDKKKVPPAPKGNAKTARKEKSASGKVSKKAPAKARAKGSVK